MWSDEHEQKQKSLQKCDRNVIQGVDGNVNIGVISHEVGPLSGNPPCTLF